jgi:HD-GYP domain-containing protein (c-di-GMP phosphodiesterase class II)
MLSRVLALIDSYDVMTHVRPYKEALSSSKAIQEIKRCAGLQFDPDLAMAFINMLERDELH